MNHKKMLGTKAPNYEQAHVGLDLLTLISYIYCSRNEARMKITILPQGTLAIYEQIVNQLKNAVVTGELKAGEALPSIRALAADLGVSVITTKRAYEELEKEGLVRSVAGKGFYVCEYNADYLKEKQLVLLEKRLNEVIEEAKQAGLTKEDFVEMVRALYEQ